MRQIARRCRNDDLAREEEINLSGIISSRIYIARCRPVIALLSASFSFGTISFSTCVRDRLPCEKQNYDIAYIYSAELCELVECAREGLSRVNKKKERERREHSVSLHYPCDRRRYQGYFACIRRVSRAHFIFHPLPLAFSCLISIYSRFTSCLSASLAINCVDARASAR